MRFDIRNCVLLASLLIPTFSVAADYSRLQARIISLNQQFFSQHIDRPVYMQSLAEAVEELRPVDANVLLLKGDLAEVRKMKVPDASVFVARVDALAKESNASFKPGKADLDLLQKILRRREFVFEEKPHFWEMLVQRLAIWLQRMFVRIPGADLLFLSRLILVIALVCLVALLGYLIYRSTRVLPIRTNLPEVEMTTEEIHLRDPEYYRRLAEEAWSNGQYRPAARHYFYAILSVLHHAGLIPYEPSRTNGEYCRSFLSKQQDRNDVQRLRDSIIAYENCWYGNHPASTDTVAAFRNTTEIFLQKYR